MVHSSLEDHQKQEGFCKKIQEEMQEKRDIAQGFHFLKGWLCNYP
jgi:hypothetical protein